MDIQTGQQRPFPALAIVSVLFLLCLIPGQLLMARFFPEIARIAGITPSFVFLDIPTPLPISIDLILVPGLLLMIYPLLILCYPSRTGIPSWQQAIQGAGAVFTGLLAVLFCMLSGGFIYQWVQDFLPRNVRNGINSFGINADIYLPFPGYETIHLRGSMVLLVCFVIGMSVCIRKIKKVPGMQKPGRLTREQRMTPYERMLQESRQPAPAKLLTNHDQSPVNIPSITNQKRVAPNNGPGLCQRQPVMTIQPAAVNYMPMA